MARGLMTLLSFLDDETKIYIDSHSGLLTAIKNEISQWENTLVNQLIKENPFVKEMAFIKMVKAKKLSEIETQFEEIERTYREIVEETDLDFSYYKNTFKKSKEQKKKAIALAFIHDMEISLINRRNIWELQLIDSLRKEWVKQFFIKLDKFKKLEMTFSLLIGEFARFLGGGDFGLLWGISEGLFKESGFEILEMYADLLEKDESLQELARVLGKHSRAQKEYEKELREKTVIKNVWRSRPAFKGQVTGIHTSDNISSALPTELALFKNPATKLLFKKKFAEKGLLSFKYENIMPEQKRETEMEEVSKEKQEQKGPIIICVDTSGSMNGTPESIAKTVAFALSKIAIEEKRKCYLISFSTEIETMDLSDFKGGQALEKLIQFLRMSFNGGTDALPALHHALEMLQKDDYKNADVLMVSDFVMGELGTDMEQKIQAEQKKKTDFYSLVIGSNGNTNTIACFNHNWSYNLYDSNASRHLVEQIQEIKKK